MTKPAARGGASPSLSVLISSARPAFAEELARLAEGVGARVLHDPEVRAGAIAGLGIIDVDRLERLEQLRGLFGKVGAIIAVVPEGNEVLARRTLDAGADDITFDGTLTRDLPLRISTRLRSLGAREELVRRERDLRTLVELTRSFAGTLDVSVLLHDVTRRLAEELALRRCSFVLVDDAGTLGTVVAASDAAAVSKTHIELHKYPEILEALRTRKAVVVEDAERHPLLDPVKEAISAAGLGALAVLPLVLEERLLGVLFLRAPAGAGGRGFTTREIDFAAAVANATAVALRNARSVEEIQVRVRRAEAKAEELERFADVFEHVSDGIALISFDGRILALNPAARTILRVEATAAIGRKMREVIEPVDVQTYREAKDRMLAGEVAHVELPALRLDGSRVELSLSASPLRSANLAILSFRDVTEKRRFDSELRRTKEFLEKLIDSSVDGIVAADLRGQIILFNKGAERLIGYSAAEVVGKLHVTKLYAEGGAREVMHLLRSGEYGGVGRLAATKREIVHASGARIPVQMSAAIISEHGRPIATVGIFTDLRDLLRIEDKLTLAQAKLEKTERQAMLAELAGTAAHELNQPLTSVMGYAELLKRRIGLDDPNGRAVDIIYREAERMAQLVRRIGKITRYETKEYVGSARIVDLDRASGETDE